MPQGTPELIKALGQIDPHRPYGIELFDALARVTISVAVEAVCLRLNTRLLGFAEEQEHFLEVYMIQRSPDDTAYPGEWHCPGSVLRPRENIDDVFSRLQKKEFGGPLEHWRFVVNVNHPTEERGHFFSLVYLCVLKDAGILRGKWFPVDQLPGETVEHHRRRIIPAAVGAFVAENTNICD